MQAPPVSGGAVLSRVLLVGQAPGAREPLLGRPFAWTAGKRLLSWFQQWTGVTEQMFPRPRLHGRRLPLLPGPQPGWR